MRVAYLGNFEPAHSTETHVAASLEDLGHEVVRIQEGSLAASGGNRDSAARRTIAAKADVFLWTQTLSLAEKMGSRNDRLQMLRDINEAGIPTAGFHLDRWWGLSRETRVRTEPWFQMNHIFTADGGHPDLWEKFGINHHWLPPGVYHAEAHRGTPREEYRSQVAFVGSWQAYGHREYAPVRQEMIRQLQGRYGDGFKAWPPPGAPRIVYPDLNDLYASADVIVGDSCLAPRRDNKPIARYWSDRVSETTGRGGILVHPKVEGLDDWHPSVVTFPLGRHEVMFTLIDALLADVEFREDIRNRQHQETLQKNTYRERMQDLLRIVSA